MGDEKKIAVDEIAMVDFFVVVRRIDETGVCCVDMRAKSYVSENFALRTALVIDEEESGPSEGQTIVGVARIMPTIQYITPVCDDRLSP